MAEELDPLYHEISRKKVLFAKFFTGITVIIVLLAVIFCLVKGSTKSSLYLCVANLTLSSIVAGLLAWWYHKGVLQANTYYFMLFVGLCVIFQAIVIDIFAWHWEPMSSESNAHVNPYTVSPANHTSTTSTPHFLR